MTYDVIESKALQVYQYLTGRRHFSQEDKIAFYNEKRGYEGEKKLEKLLKEQQMSNHIALYGLLLENKGTLFQLDCLLIFRDQIIMIEVKNFKGEFEFRDERLYSISNNKYYQHPLHQLQRSDTNLREVLSKLKINLPLQSYVFFVHQEFTLFTERNPTIILPTQLHSVINKFKQLPGKLNAQHHNLAENLVALHLEESPYIRLPEYDFAALRKGVHCHVCRGLMLKNWKHLSCQRCSYKESFDSAVLRSVIEFNTLFPEKKITTRDISEWCAFILTDRTIRRILKAYLRHHFKNTTSYFSFK